MSALRYTAPALLFAATFVSALLVLAPASLLRVQVERATDGRLTLADTTGKVWRGHANLTGASSSTAVPVAWSIAGISVSPPEVAVGVRVGGAAPVKLTAGIDRTELGHVDVVLPAPLVADAVKGVGSYRPGGIVRLQSDYLRIEHQSLTGRFLMNWIDASTGMIDVVPLGSFVIDCEVTKTGGAATIKSVAGPLLANGGVRWSGSNYAVEIEARAAGPRTDVLAAWLRTVAVEKPGGVFNITWAARGR